MSDFSKETYEKILSSNTAKTRTTNWYNVTYEHYIRILNDNKLDRGSKGFYGPDDFVIAAAFAFSWLARIPTFPSNDINFDKPVDVIYHFSQIDNGNYNLEKDKEIIMELVSIMDNSIVAVSKMIHFLSPDYFPIIDSKVIISWNSLFPQYKLPKKIDVDRYLSYAQLMREWSLKSGVSLRNLEKALFEYQAK